MRSKHYRLPRLNPWRLAPLLLLSVSFAMMAGCVQQVRTVTDYCTPWKPIYVAANDVLSDPTAKAILEHDETGVKLGCWKAPTPSSGKR